MCAESQLISYNGSIALHLMIRFFSAFLNRKFCKNKSNQFFNTEIQTERFFYDFSFFDYYGYPDIQTKNFMVQNNISPRFKHEKQKKID